MKTADQFIIFLLYCANDHITVTTTNSLSTGKGNILQQL
jgi:hypothetical protein